ncbi:MAG: LacI family DNA-binding transcriptional regulator, partial [Trueperaceae bacterium]|nr:LacI family DNA-binding transcriptional regulator [Trueperaceae bacterium]
MATIHDVARHAGVSTATVSHVLNGTRFVRPATRAAVEAAIEELDYTPSSVARGLSMKHTRTIGVVIADVTAPFFARLLKAVENLLTAAGYSIMVVNAYEDATREAEGLETLRQRQVDGILITPTGAPQDAYSGLAAIGCPIVFVERMPPGASGSLASTDNRGAMEACVHYLHELGHRRMAIVTLDEATSAVSARVEGFERALRALGSSPDEHLIVTCGPTLESAERAIAEILASSAPPTAIIAGNHIASLGAMRAIRAAGLDLPTDISLICFDNSPWTEVMLPPLTVVTKPIEELAQRAVVQLLASIDEGRRRQRDQEAPSDLPTSTVLLPAPRRRRGRGAGPGGGGGGGGG